MLVSTGPHTASWAGAGPWPRILAISARTTEPWPWACRPCSLSASRWLRTSSLAMGTPLVMVEMATWGQEGAGGPP